MILARSISLVSLLALSALAGNWIGKVTTPVAADNRAFIACYPDGDVYAEHFIAEGISAEEFSDVLRKVCDAKITVRWL